MSHQILLYYLYRRLADPEAYLEEHRALCQELDLLGRILIGDEGINGTVSGSTESTERYMAVMRGDERTSGIEFKVDLAGDHVFPKLSVKLRSEVVTLGLGEDDIDPNEITGKRLGPEEWLEAMREDDVILLDGRNDYESALGHFKGALCPDVENFRDFPEWIRENLADKKDAKVLTYCTGGIRCEKLSGFLLQEGFQDVSQLHGGIVEYGKHSETQGRDFDGLCYVFDQRVGVEVNHTDSRKIVSSCWRCNEPCSRYCNCGWPECNDQIFLCEKCENEFGKFCGEACKSAFLAESA
ncbi:MAG: rhodanese-related sulfurtransferase [Verrucomicrobiota bacterium]